MLSGETQERERVLFQFSRRFHHCNPGLFSSVGRRAGLWVPRAEESCAGVSWWQLVGCAWGLWRTRSVWGSPAHCGQRESRVRSQHFLSTHLSGTDSVHTLTCAIMLLNTDLHGQVSTWGERLWDPRPRRGQGRPWGTGEGSRVAGRAFPPGGACQLSHFSPCHRTLGRA